LWFSDLRAYTSISENSLPDQILPLLNDYAEAAISAVHDCGGDVLKLIGDAILAIFKADNATDACRSALQAEADLREKIQALNLRRHEQNQPVTSIYLGLHIGDVFYGNIGSPDRLDFTVIGPAVNEVARIASMCRSVDRPVLLSSSFVETLPPEERNRFVSVGRYALRGSNRPQELFTPNPERLN
jgi:adenylate cyclase